MKLNYNSEEFVSKLKNIMTNINASNAKDDNEKYGITNSAKYANITPFKNVADISLYESFINTSNINKYTNNKKNIIKLSPNRFPFRLT